jgi:hypothetical protein
VRRWYKSAWLMILVLLPAPAFAQDSGSGPYLNTLLFAGLDIREREDLGDDGVVAAQGVGQFNLSLNDRLSFFSEMTLTNKHGGTTEWEVERLFARYDFSDHFKASVGRFHTPVGYWNTAFHHGSWLQTTIGRPETMRFGSNVVPIHFAGGLLEGNVGDTSFGYRIGAGNGRSKDKINDTPDIEETFDNSAFLIGGTYRTTGRNRIEVGVSAFVDEPTAQDGTHVDETILNAYFVMPGETPEVIIEYTYSNHDSNRGDGNVHSIYGQIAYRLDEGASAFKPYLRVEDLDVDDSDPLLGSLNLDYDGVTAGFRWDFAPFAALKIEVRREKFGRADRRNSAWLQLAFVTSMSTRS